MVGLCDEAVDSSLKVDHTAEDTALEPLLGKFGEEPFDCIEPRARGRREVESEARVAGEAIEIPSDACGQHNCRGSRARSFEPAPAPRWH